jgi:hypothetical protein
MQQACAEPASVDSTACPLTRLPCILLAQLLFAFVAFPFPVLQTTVGQGLPQQIATAAAAAAAGTRA